METKNVKNTSRRKTLAIVSFLLLLLCILPSVSAVGTITYVAQYRQATGYGTFSGPQGVAVDNVSDMPGFWVSDTGNNTMVKLSLTGQLMVVISSPAGLDKPLLRPSACVVDAVGNLYVSDTNNKRIVEFSKTGAYLTQWATDGSYPAGIGIDSLGNVYVAGMDNRVFKFTSDGTLIKQWGETGSGKGQFNGLSGLGIDSQDNVYIAEWVNNRIQKFTSDGTYITQWGSVGTGNGEFKSPIDLAVDSNDLIYVTDGFASGNYRIQIFTGTGVYLSQWGEPGSGNGQFNTPFRLDFDASGKAYVADQGNKRIQVFNIEGPFVAPEVPWGTTILAIFAAAGVFLAVKKTSARKLRTVNSSFGL